MIIGKPNITFWTEREKHNDKLSTCYWVGQSCYHIVPNLGTTAIKNWLIFAILAIKVCPNKILLSKTLWDLMRMVVKLCNLETPGNLI